MTARPSVVSPEDRTRSLSVVGAHITVLASEAQTGSHEISSQAGPEGSGPPSHNHPWDEAFYVMRGEVAFGIGDRESLAVEGTLVQVPGGTTHCFRYGRGGGETLSMTSGEGASAFFTDLERNVSPENPDLGKFIGITESHGLRIPLPPRYFRTSGLAIKDHREDPRCQAGLFNAVHAASESM
jgi:quercetin dioxygenase-like cupin family protein